MNAEHHLQHQQQQQQQLQLQQQRHQHQHQHQHQQQQQHQQHAILQNVPNTTNVGNEPQASQPFNPTSTSSNKDDVTVNSGARELPMPLHQQQYIYPYYQYTGNASGNNNAATGNNTSASPIVHNNSNNSNNSNISAAPDYTAVNSNTSNNSNNNNNIHTNQFAAAANINTSAAAAAYYTFPTANMPIPQQDQQYMFNPASYIGHYYSAVNNSNNGNNAANNSGSNPPHPAPPPPPPHHHHHHRSNPHNNLNNGTVNSNNAPQHHPTIITDQFQFQLQQNHPSNLNLNINPAQPLHLPPGWKINTMPQPHPATTPNHPPAPVPPSNSVALNSVTAPSSDHKYIHQCQFCEKSFKRKSWLKRHLLSHSQQRHFLCPWCLSRQKRKDNLLQHMKLKHTNYLLDELKKNNIIFNYNNSSINSNNSNNNNSASGSAAAAPENEAGNSYDPNIKTLINDGVLNKDDVKRVLNNLIVSHNK